MGMASRIKAFVLSLLPARSLLTRGDVNHVYLTFDDGPDPDKTPRLLDLLKRQGARATFFVQGAQVDRYPEVARRIVEDGHTIAGHSWTHRRLTQWAFIDAWSEFDRTRRAIRAATGVETILYRPPYGWVTLPMLIYAALGRIKLVLWTVDSDDDRTDSVNAIRAKCDELRGGEIVLCHDDNAAIQEVLPELLGRWRSRGLEIVALEDHA